MTKESVKEKAGRKVKVNKGTYSVSQMADKLGISGTSVRNKIAAGTLPGKNMGKQYIIVLPENMEIHVRNY